MSPAGSEVAPPTAFTSAEDPDADGKRLYVLDPNTTANGGGLHAIRLHCDGTLSDEGLVLPGEREDALPGLQGLHQRRQPAGHPEEGRAHQTYCLPVFRYGNLYLGYTMIYNVGTDRSVDCELSWSPDSLTWQRVAPGTPLIPRGPKGSYDGACIYAMAGPPIRDGNDLLIFYGGDHFPHTGWKRSCTTCSRRNSAASKSTPCCWA